MTIRRRDVPRIRMSLSDGDYFEQDPDPLCVARTLPGGCVKANPKVYPEHYAKAHARHVATKSWRTGSWSAAVCDPGAIWAAGCTSGVVGISHETVTL